MRSYSYTTSCAGGLESLVGSEIEIFGGTNIVCGKGSVAWSGTLENGYRAVLWSRFGSRVFLHLEQFYFTDEDSLYRRSNAIDWQAILKDEATFAINCTISGDSPVMHNRFAALRLKDGLVDRFRDMTGNRPSVQPMRPDLQLHLHLEREKGIVAVDLSGESLHRRGYRVEGGLAPLKETLAAAIIALTEWDGHKPLVDPMCGTGTLLIEAALMFSDSAPGLSRSYFGFSGWTGHDNRLWGSLVDEAVKREEAGMVRKWPRIIGYDSDPAALRAARANVTKAGFDEQIQVQQAELANLSLQEAEGLLLTNLPFGERMSDKEVVQRLYRAYGRIGNRLGTGWQIGAFISAPELTDSFGITWKEKLRLYNGPIACRLLLGDCLATGDESFVWPLNNGESKDDNDLANRLRKNLKQFLKWAQKEDISCFRIYDSDLPEYNCCIDIYGKWVHIQEYAPPKSVPTELAEERFRLTVQTVKEVLNLRSDRLFLKTRSRQRGRKQYQRQGTKSKLYEVREGSCYFLVNFTDYLDTGLFLDHRPVRRYIFQQASGKRFLNLFGYTATASVQAAAGGATRTTTVDLSANYLRWGRCNFALNGFAEQKHRLIVADCMEWLADETDMYDFIFVDPPTFSNTKKKERVFDIQRDHETLVHQAMRRLAPEGVLLFSTNYTRFQIAAPLMEAFALENITQQTIPVDFQRHRKIHQCWEIRHNRQ